jgi:Fur family transcriptional regulator, peroxide stress response regulator
MNMDTQEKQSRLELFELLCRETGVPCTAQRRIILETVLQSKSHPTANEVFNQVAARHLGVSRATVHRNLDIMAGMGVITKTCHPGNAARYDGRIDIHHHLVCLKCNSIVDIDDDHLNAIKIPDTSSFGFEVSDFRVQLRGYCRSCLDAGVRKAGKR